MHTYAHGNKRKNVFPPFISSDLRGALSVIREPDEGVCLIYLRANCNLLVSLSLRGTKFFSFLSSTFHLSLPPPQSWAHSKSSLLLCDPLLSNPYCS